MEQRNQQIVIRMESFKLRNGAHKAWQCCTIGTITKLQLKAFVKLALRKIISKQCQQQNAKQAYQQEQHRLQWHPCMPPFYPVVHANCCLVRAEIHKRKSTLAKVAQCTKLQSSYLLNAWHD